jgi:hypothetical protein
MDEAEHCEDERAESSHARAAHTVSGKTNDQNLEQWNWERLVSGGGAIRLWLQLVPKRLHN